MSCFSCFSSNEKKRSSRYEAPSPVVYTRTNNSIKKPEYTIAERRSTEYTRTENPRQNIPNEKKTSKETNNGNIAAETFTFRELASATKNFLPEYLLGEGGFGRVYKGHLETTGQVVAVKQLDRNGLQGNKEFLVEVLMLSLLHHQNLVNLIGYCADGDQRLLVYEFMPLGSLEDHLFEISSHQEPLGWYTRMKIAHGAATGLEYLHDEANPPVIYRDLKSSNILLDQDFNPKLSDFGLAKLGPLGNKVQVSSRIMGTYGYCAPEYARTGELTVKSDVYSFGVVLLELITGRRAIDTTRDLKEENLVTWAQPMFRDQKSFQELVDPLLEEDYPERGLNQAVAVAAMCLQEEASARPLIADVVSALSFLTVESSSVDFPSFQLPEERTLGAYDEQNEESTADRRSVTGAMEWGANSRDNQRYHVEVESLI